MEKHNAFLIELTVTEEIKKLIEFANKCKREGDEEGETFFSDDAKRLQTALQQFRAVYA